MRLLGAVHRLLLDGRGHALAKYYPSLGGAVDTTDVIPSFVDFVEGHRDLAAREMKRPVQTNEVGQAVPLSAAMSYIAHTRGLPISLLEVGSSAGLNLWLDRYRVIAPKGAWGPEDSPVVLEGCFESGEPPLTDFLIVSRRGCDLQPLDVRNPDHARLLRSFVWPEHVKRLARLDAAIEVAGDATTDARPAAEWLRDMLAQLRDSCITVVFHSVVLPYMTPAEKAEFASILQNAGDRATADRQLGWVSLEPSDHADSELELHLRAWPGEEELLLATCAPHGSSINWRPAARDRG